MEIPEEIDGDEKLQIQGLRRREGQTGGGGERHYGRCKVLAIQGEGQRNAGRC